MPSDQVQWMSTGARCASCSTASRTAVIPSGASLQSSSRYGSQRMPMISLRDYLAVVHWAASNEQASGPYNLTIPRPATNAEFSDALAAALHRPRFLRAPAPIIRTALG